jgi:glucose-1-phosphate cytidylyltransferase
VLEPIENWKVTLLDTGLDTMTGGRIIRAKDLLKNESFMLTYGDGLADIDINALKDFHCSRGKIATVTGISKSNQYGVLSVSDDIATSFVEKPDNIDIINGGFFVFNKEIFDYLKTGDECILEKEPLIRLAEDKQLAVYRHNGFWTAMDTYKDLMSVNELWERNLALWKVW